MAVDSEVLEKKIDKSVLDIATFNDIIVGAYNDGTAEDGLEADEGVARSLIPAGTGLETYRSVEIPPETIPNEPAEEEEEAELSIFQGNI